MKQWKKASPGSHCYLRYDKLYVDNRLFTWDKEAQEVVEQEGQERTGGPPYLSK